MLRITINEKRGYKFEGGGVVLRRVCRVVGGVVSKLIPQNKEQQEIYFD